MAIQLNDNQKKTILKVLKVTAVLVPVLVAAATAYLTGTPFDIVGALQVVVPALLSP